MCYRSNYQEPVTNKNLHIIYVQYDFTFGKYAEYLHLEIFQGVVDQVTKAGLNKRLSYVTRIAYHE